MAYIARDGGVITLINVFTVSPEDQKRLVDLLARATEEVVSRQPGYVSATFTRALTAHGSPTMPSGGAGRTSRRYSAIRRSSPTCARQRGLRFPTSRTSIRSPIRIRQAEVRGEEEGVSGRFEITPRGPYSLAASVRFLKGFAPAAYDGGGWTSSGSPSSPTGETK